MRKVSLAFDLVNYLLINAKAFPRTLEPACLVPLHNKYDETALHPNTVAISLFGEDMFPAILIGYVGAVRAGVV